MPPVKEVACPQCGARVAWTPQSRFRPFCSERCRLIDLGAWASESYHIPVSPSQDAEPGEDVAGPSVDRSPNGY
jgi:endogenous inhibitor of DNA gyrase (YacG/DUF329 family)